MSTHTILAALVLVAAAVPAGAQPVVPTELRDGAHDMDFQTGSWRTDVTITKDPFNHPEQTTHMTGTKVARPIWNGKGFIEEIEADGPSGHWEGLNLFLYDPVAHEWSQNYADGETGRMDGMPSIGRYRNGNLEFYWVDRVAGQTILMRGIWKDFTPNSHVYEISRSNDGARTWHTSFVARVTRAQ